jgi:hypothetical protein
VISRSGVGSTVDPEIDTLNKRLRRFITGRLAGPGGPSQSRRMTCRDGVTSGWRLTAVRTVVCSPKRARWRAVGNRVPVRLLLEEGGARTRRSRSCGGPKSTATVAWMLRQRPQIRWCWRRWACSSPRAIRRYPLAETASRLDNLGALPFETRTARRPLGSTPVVTRRHDDQCAFSTLPREHSAGSRRWPDLISVRERMAHLATLPGSSPVSHPFEKGRLPPRRLGLCPRRRSGKPAVGG